MFEELLKKFKKTKTSKFINDELIYKYYEQVSKDIQSGIKEEGVWAKAYSFAEGEEQKTKAKYIELMVERLILANEAENELLEKNKKEKYEEEKRIHKLEEERKYEEENKEWIQFQDSSLGSLLIGIGFLVSGFITFKVSETFGIFNTSNVLILILIFVASLIVYYIVLYIFWAIFKTEPKKGPRDKNPIVTDIPSEDNNEFKDFLAKYNVSYLECKHRWNDYWKAIYFKWQRDKK